MTPVQPSKIEQKYAGYDNLPLSIAVYFRAFAELDLSALSAMLLDKPDPDDTLSNARRNTATLLYSN